MRLDLHIVANFVQELSKGVSDFIVSLVGESAFCAVQSMCYVKLGSASAALREVGWVPSISQVYTVSKFRFREVEIIFLESLMPLFRMLGERRTFFPLQVVSGVLLVFCKLLVVFLFL